MISHTPLMEDAVRFGHSVRTQVDVYRGNTLVYPDVPIVGGNVKSDRKSNVRWTSDIEVSGTEMGRLLATVVTVAGCTFTVRRGVTTLGYTEMLPLGVYRVDDVSTGSRGSFKIKGSGDEAYVVSDRFLVPRQPPYGQSTIQAIADLVGESMTVQRGVLAMNTYDKPVRMTAAWERDRIKAIGDLAQSIKAEVYADSTGTWVIKDDPTLQLAAYTYLINAGDGGVLIDYEGGDTRDGVYNAVSVTGRASEVEGQPPVWGMAVDDDPRSPTYWGGPFGHVPRFYSNDGIDSAADCVAIAKSILQGALTANRSFSFTSAVVCFLEAGDVVRVELPDRSWKDYLLNSTSLDLGVGGRLAAETYKVRDSLENAE